MSYTPYIAQLREFGRTFRPKSNTAGLLDLLLREESLDIGRKVKIHLFL